jgi:prepilin-type N-terminal cleavage/methylation domain-containing protein
MRIKRGLQRGFSLGELLVVIAIVALAAGVSIPLVAEQFRQAKIRGAADQFTMTLKAARMIAVTKRATVDVTVVTDSSTSDPPNTYTYPDQGGTLRTVQLPDGVRIVSSTSPISFRLNGSIPAAATTVMEADLTSGTTERWTVTTSILGVPTISHQRID